MILTRVLVLVHKLYKIQQGSRYLTTTPPKKSHKIQNLVDVCKIYMSVILVQFLPPRCKKIIL